MAKNIAIIGAGLSGLTCAYELSNKGHHVTLFEKSRGPSGRSSTKRWDNTTGIGIDLGVPYIEESVVKHISSSLIRKLIDEKIVSHWPMTQQKNGERNIINTYVGSPKMSQISRFLSKNTTIKTEHKVNAISFNKTWNVYTNTTQDDGFDDLVIAIPAPQITNIEGVDDEILTHAKSIQYNAINTLLIELKSPLWFTGIDEDVINGPILKTVIADYLKPNRVLGRYTYTVHSQHEWATKQFDSHDKKTVENIMLDSVLTHYNRKPHLVLKHHIHRWKYAVLDGPLESLQTGYLKSTSSPLFVCGDWCQGHTVMSAIESGYLLAHNMTR